MQRFDAKKTVKSEEGEFVKYEDVRQLEKEIANYKFDIEGLLKFTVDMLSHEQLIKYAARKKEVFG